MANTKTLAQLKTEVRQQSDQENSDFISDAELTTYINSAYGEYNDLLISRYEDIFTQETDLTITTGNVMTLPTNFIKLRGVDFNSTSDGPFSLRHYNFNERNKYDNLNVLFGDRYSRVYRVIGEEIHILPANAATGTYTVHYIPAFTPLVLDTDTVNGWNGWEEYIVVDAAIRVLQKEESDTSDLQRRKQALLLRIETMAQNRDTGGIETITDASLNDGYWGY